MTRSLASRLALLVLFAACAPTPRGDAPGNSAGAAEERFSVYDIPSSWRDQHGALRTLGSLAGTPQVVAMIYTHCTATCPLSIAEMKRIEHATGPRVGLVLVSLDPERDTPAQLAAYAEHAGLTGGRWTLLSGGDDDTRALAAAIGVRYRRMSPTELAHSNTLTLLDASGLVITQQTGLGADDDLLRAIRALPTPPGSL